MPIDYYLYSSKPIRTKPIYSPEQAQTHKDFQLDYSDTILYLGKEYPIVAKPFNRIGFDFEQFYMPPNLSSKEIKSACVSIYRRLAKRDLTNRVHEYAKEMSVMPAAMRISNAKTRWGSCSSKKNVNFSWQLIMADSDAVDYVVVHELAHIREMNHSARFWVIVEGILPDYQQRKAKLRQLEQRICEENW